jgi:ATP-dependent helicase/nuclease subunit A
MIDEFQDDNSDQKDMLFYLAEKLQNYRTAGVPHPDELEKEKLFFVGDEKQSIYMFRGADVSVFKKLSDELKNDEPVTLSRNYRSCPQLIASFNSIFGGEPYPPDKKNSKEKNISVFEKPSKDLPVYEAVYSNALPKEEDEKCNNWTQHVHFAFADNDKDSNNDEDILSPQENEAAYVAKKIKTLVDEEKYKPSDICILFKKYSEQFLFEKYLRFYKLPYLTQTFVGIFGDGPANDFFSFLKICCLPQDIKAYATVLASPFINLKSSTIEKLISLFNGKVFDENCQQLLSHSELLRFQKGKELYDFYAKKFTEQSLSETISNLWYDLGYRYETLWNNTVYRFSELYDLIYEMACQADEEGKGLFELVENAETFKGETTKLGEVDVTTEHEDAISIMSVHKSKGLEFPVVFVSSLKQQNKRETEEKVFYSDETGLSINLPKSPLLISDKVNNYFFMKLKAEKQNKDRAELKRLLYVAFTRAEKELYVTSVKPSQTADSMLSILQPVIDFYENSSPDKTNWPFEIDTIPLYSRKDFEKKNESDKIKTADMIAKKFESLDVIEKQIVPKNHFTPSHLHETDDDDISFVDNTQTKETMSKELYKKIDEIIFETMDEQLQKPKFSFSNFGTIAHAFMEAKLLDSKPVISQKDIKYLSKKQEETIYEICNTFADLFLQTELGNNAYNASWKKTEYQFKSNIAGMILTGSIDLTFEDDSGNIIIVDYKTNKEINPEIYYRQLAAYRQAISAMRDIPLEKIQCYLYYLRYAKTVNITEGCKSINLEEVLKNAENI